MARYRFIRYNDKIICLSTYAKKVVRGIAKCSPNDTFSVTVGEKLAQLRCDKKVEAKRLERARAKRDEAIRQMNEAQTYWLNMEEYYKTSQENYTNICNELNHFEQMI